MLWVTVLGTIVAVAVVYMALKIREKLAKREGVMPGSQPDGQIKRAIERSWKPIVEFYRDDDDQSRYYQRLKPLFGSKIEVHDINRMSDTLVAALVSTQPPWPELPDLGRALLLGTSADLAETVERSRRKYFPDLSEDLIIAFAMYDDELGRWDFGIAEGEEWEAVPDVSAAIGEPVLLQNSWKEPPFTITVLDLPEIVNTATVRLPVRITAIIPLWPYDGSGFALGCLTDVCWQDGQGREWCNGIYDPDPPLPPGEADPFEGVVLVRGGSHEGFLIFREEDGSTSDARGQDFVELHYLDGSEQVIVVDLRRSVPPAERIEFRDGVPERKLNLPGIMARLEKSGTQWEDAGNPPATVGIGDTVSLPSATDGRPWLDLTVLGPPEPVAGNMIRLPLRITARARGGHQYRDFPLQLSTAPDRYGRIHHIWGSAGVTEEGRSGMENSLGGITLRRGQSREGYVYFRPSGDAHGMPGVPFTTLWYGPYLLELPVNVRAVPQ